MAEQSRSCRDSKDNGENISLKTREKAGREKEINRWKRENEEYGRKEGVRLKVREKDWETD